MAKEKVNTVELSGYRVFWKGKRKDGVKVQGMSDKCFELAQAEYLAVELEELTGVKHWAERGC
jgi:hypothetical protein